MLPGNLQYWQPCGYGAIKFMINEPIHFAGPSPGDQSTIAEEVKMEYPKTSQSDQPQMTDQDDPYGAAQQSPPEEITPQVQRPINEETKEPEPSQIVQPDVGASMSDRSGYTPLRVKQQQNETVQQSADANQFSLQAF